MSVSKIVAAAASGVGGAGLDVDEVFSTYVYDGSSSGQTITNGIDLSGEGGLVWTKDRTSTSAQHALFDTERGVLKGLASSSTAAEANETGSVTAFNSNGYTLGTWSGVNYNGIDYVSWTWRKAPRFFDVQTYSGTGSAQNISHSLGSVPGMILVKKTNASTSWTIYHRSLGATKYLLFDTSDAGTQTARWNDTAPTSTQFTVGTAGGTNDSGDTYVAYLFAHNDSGDGEFGPDSDQDIIKCGTYTGNANSTGPIINLGFEPQWLMIKRTDSTDNWYMLDTMRGILTNGGNDTYLYANTSGAEATVSEVLKVTATGFQLEDGFGGWNANGGTYIYMAIRRGPLAVPDDATKVFAINTRSSSDGEGKYTSGFPVDFSLANNYDQAGNTFAGTRLTNAHLQTNSTVAESTSATDYQWDHNDGLGIGEDGAFFGGSTNNINWMWKRAKGFFDVLAYTGTGSATTIAHQLGVVPEMIWVKSRNQATDWAVYHKDLSAGQYVMLNKTNAVDTNSAYFTTTAPTSSVFSIGVGEYTNQSSSYTYVAYLFATVAGVSKVGSYTGNDGTTNVDCGFSNGARFILIKKTNGSGDWFIFDSTRGIVAGNDPSLKLNTAEAPDDLGARDIIDPLSSGFTVNANRGGVNDNGDTFLFYAVA